MKRWICAILSVLLICSLAGCKPQDEIDAGAGASAQPLAAAGRYVEDELSLPLPQGETEQYVLGISWDSEGMQVFTTAASGDEENFRCNYYRHTISGDGTALTREEAWLNSLAPKGGNEIHLLSAGGALYACYSDYDQNNNQVAHILVSRDGGKTGEELTGGGVGGIGCLTSMGVLANGQIAANNFYDGTLVLLNADGSLDRELESGGRGPIGVCAAGGGQVAFAVKERDLVRVYDQASQAYTEYPFQFAEDSYPSLAVSEDGTVYLADATGIYRHASGGTLWERLVDGETATLGLPDFYVGTLAARESGPYAEFYVGSGAQLLSYRYDETMTAVADKELTVFSLTDSDTVRQAIVAFSRARSDVKVTYTVAMDGASGGTAQDYVKALNTELLAGTGPDILLLDGLPVDSYIEKDVLTDLTEVLAGAEPLMENILAAEQTENGVYAVPTGFGVPIAIAAPGTEDAFDSLPALADAAESAGETPLLSKCAFSYKTLALYLLKYYGGGLRSGDAAAVEAFLRDAARICSATKCTGSIAEGWDVLKDMPQDELYQDFKDYISAPQIFACASGLAKSVITQPMTSVGMVMEPAALAERNGASLTDVAGQFVPMGLVGINKASLQQEAAGAFVQALLSYQAQGGNPYAQAMPVNRQAFEEMIAYENPNVGSGMVLNDGAELSAAWPDKAFRDRLAQLILTLDTPIREDAALTDMLLSEVEACLDGTNTQAQAAERILSVMATYLSE